jgi:hypothetical protein
MRGVHCESNGNGMSVSIRCRSTGWKQGCVLVWAAAVLVVASRLGWSQMSTQPTQLPGATSVELMDSTFVFHGVGVTYLYSLREPDPGRGTLRALTVKTSGGETFWPSNFGGIKAELAGALRCPWDPQQWPLVHHRLVSAKLEGDSVAVMIWTIRAGNDSCLYSYRFSLSGQTLVMHFEGDDTRKAAGLGFNNANTPSNEDLHVIGVPCLPIMNVLFVRKSGVFVTLFVDWESSNASGIRAWYDGKSKTTGYYSQMIEYEPLTSGQRNQLGETAYLSVARDIESVLPNLVPPSGSPTAPMRDTLLHRMVVSDFNPFPLLNHPRTFPGGGYLGLLDSVSGARHVAFIVKNWNSGQFDRNYPQTWPPDDFQDPTGIYGVYAKGGGAAGLKAVADALKRDGYLFGLHENYVDYYDRTVHRPAAAAMTLSCGLLPNGQKAEAFDNADARPPQRSFLLKPSIAAKVATAIETTRIIPGLSPNAPQWCYLDVSSSVNPSGPLVSETLEQPANPRRSYVDFDAGLGADAGKFIATVKAYRGLAAAVRRNYNGPVQGEGGNHFLYAGYFDGFEGRLTIGNGDAAGYRVPLLVAFAQRIRDKSAVHGVGHIQDFFRQYRAAISDAQVKTFMATELAYGHGGLVTVATTNLADHSLKQAQWEQKYLMPVQRLYAGAEPVSVTYYDAANKPFSVSDYIRLHPTTFDVIEDPDNFMGRIRVVYSDSLEVWVNRTRQPWDLGAVGKAGGWFSDNAFTGGPDTVLASGRRPDSTRFVLPAENGWVCYSPTEPGSP